MQLIWQCGRERDNKIMKFKISRFEAKLCNRDNWKMVSDVTALRMLQDKYGNITPIISEMLRGKEIKIAQGVLRIRKLKE